MPNRDLKVNELRASKQSSRLVLEEHSHCEVPAGCGGVVLRWRSAALVPFHMWLYAPGQEGQVVTIDGVVPDSSRALLKSGLHVLTLQLRTRGAEGALFMFAGLSETSERGPNQVPVPPAAGLRVLSAPDGSWKHTLVPPADDAWMQPGFDDSGWPALAGVAFGPPSDREKYILKRMQEKEAVGLGLPESKGAGFLSTLFHQRGDRPVTGTKVFIRRTFRIQDVT
jgi:hypothetical protein